MTYKAFISALTFLCAIQSMANTVAPSVSSVIRLRGTATQLPNNSVTAIPIHVGDFLKEDTSIVTKENSFVQLKFNDGSLLSVGPNSHVVIVKLNQEGKGIISLLKGQIRNKVVPMLNSGDNKIIIKTRMASVGVRGTEFQTIYNPENKTTNLLTFNGKVAMAHLEKESPTEKELNEALHAKDVTVVEKGNTSIISPKQVHPTKPTPVLDEQLKALDKNEEMLTSKELPPSVEEVQKVDLSSTSKGSVVDLNSGLIIPSSIEGSKIDSSTGEFIPPKGLELDPVKGFVVSEKVDDDKEREKLLKEQESLNHKLDEVNSQNNEAIQYLRLNQFRLLGIIVRQTETKNNFQTVSLGWNPSYNFDSSKGVALKFSLFPLPVMNSSSGMLAYSVGISGLYKVFNENKIELGFGRQKWGKLSDAGWEYSVAYLHKINNKYLSNIVLSAQYFDRPSYPYNPAIEFGLGAEFNF